VEISLSPSFVSRACRIQHLLIILRLTFRALEILLISGILKNRTDALPVRMHEPSLRGVSSWPTSRPQALCPPVCLPSTAVTSRDRRLNCKTAGSHQDPSSVKPHANPYDESGKQHLAFSLTSPVMPRKKVTCIPRRRPPVQAIPARFSVTLTRLL
jgi:hypothetical protein